MVMCLLNRPSLWVSACLLVLSVPAWAERPMAVDDAGTLERGGAKIEWGWSKDAAQRGLEAALGFGPLENVEAEINFAHARDHATQPKTVWRAVGMALKWVPLQADQGLSAGLKYEYGRERADGEPPAHAHALSGLASWTFAAGPRLHTNLGRTWTRHAGHVNTWGIGLDIPVQTQWAVTLETFGETHSKPDRQLGVRYEILEGLKLSAAVGRGNGRSTTNVGMAWEF
jgi:hypothetical protein